MTATQPSCVPRRIPSGPRMVCQGHWLESSPEATRLPVKATAAEGAEPREATGSGRGPWSADCSQSRGLGWPECVRSTGRPELWPNPALTSIPGGHRGRGRFEQTSPAISYLSDGQHDSFPKRNDMCVDRILTHTKTSVKSHFT